MPEIDANDPLSRNTARLSISIPILEEEGNPRHLVAEFLRASNGSRRDSAVSITSLNEEADVGTSLSGFKDKQESFKLNNASDRPKRRRSSTPSITSGNNKTSSIKSEVKIHKKKLKKAQEPPTFELVTSDNADKKHPSIKKLSFTNIRDLIVHILNKDSNSRLSWIRLKQTSEIKKIVFCLIPGLRVEDFIGPESKYKDDKFVPMSQVSKIEGLNFFNDTFDSLIQATAPGSKDSLFLALHTLTNVPLTKKEKKEQIDNLRKTKLTLWDLLLNKKDMIDNNYPIPKSMKDNEDLVDSDKKWVETRKFDHDGSHTFALDCEFCQSASGKVLTRISLINFQNEVIMDLLVKPEEEITDYLTKYSGITEAKLQGITTTLKDVQDKMLDIVSSDDILIGHSLESDLNVMHIKHPRIIDTALVFEHHRGPPLKPSLRWLSEKYLGRLIQEGENSGNGHSSVEDAKACLDLIKLKLQEGEYFGKNMNEISLFDRINKLRMNTKSNPIKSLLIDYTPIRDISNCNGQTNLQKMQVSNDDEAIEHLSNEISNTDFVLMKLREIEFNKGWSPIPKTYSGYLDATQENVDVNDTRDDYDLYKQLNERLTKIYSSLPENTAFIICSPLGDPRDMIRLQNVRKRFQCLEREGIDLANIPEEDNWNFEKQCDLQQAADLARKAMCFISFKRSNMHT